MDLRLLVGPGAKEWAKTRNHTIVEDEELIERNFLIALCICA